MHSRVFLCLVAVLLGLVSVTSPPVLGRVVSRPATLTPTATTVVSTPTATATPVPFAAVPTATPLGRRGMAVASASLPTPAIGHLPPTFTPAPVELLPDPLATPPPDIFTDTIAIPPPPTPVGQPPERLHIPRLELDVPVEPVGMVPSAVAPGVVEWDVPSRRIAGWLNTSAAFAQPGNTVLDGHHNIHGQVFRDLWSLEPGDDIWLWAGPRSRRYRVEEVLVLPERGQPLETRLANARYIQPTEDERLTLVTCWPYESNTHRTVVVALPVQEAGYE